MDLNEKKITEKDEDLYELSENLRLQLVMFEIEEKMTRSKIKNYKTNAKKYLFIKITKTILIILYSFLVLFEKPIHCYKSTTFYKVENKTNDTCDGDLVYLNSNFFISTKLYRIIELLFLISFAFLRIFHLKLKKKISLFNKINSYSILQISIFIIITACSIDILVSFHFDYFPLINYFLRGFLIILLIKILRDIWTIILKIFNQTKVLAFLIFCVMLFFGIVGYFLFGNKSEDFENIITSTYSLFILLSTCNFPDVMLGTFDFDNKLSVFYFVIYLAINYFILFNLLKTLYYSEAFECFKKKARQAIDIVFSIFRDKEEETTQNNIQSFNIKNEESKEDVDEEDDEMQKKRMQSSFLIPTTSRRINNLLFNINNKYYLTRNDYKKILRLINFKGDIEDFVHNNIYEVITKKYMDSKEEIKNIFENSKMLKFFTNSIVENIANILNFIIMFLVIFEFENEKINFYFFFIPHLIWCIPFIIEFVFYIKNFSFIYLFYKEYVLLLFNIINFIVLLLLIITYILYESSISTNTLMIITKIFIILKIMRIFMLFKKTNLFDIIMKTLHNMKKLFYGLTCVLFSFYYLFITLTMFLTGGKITKKAFDDDETIPNNYVNINFNDFGSGFVSCFCLTMINNINIISRSLSYKCKKYFQGYFALFYFVSTLAILTIGTTMLLEMYMSIQSNVKSTKSSKNKEEGKNDDEDDDDVIME